MNQYQPPNHQSSPQAVPHIIINNGPYPYQPKSTIVALLLCFFLGGFGFHRFYVGKVGTGVLYFFTLGLGGIGILFDFIMILIGSFRDKAGYPLQ